MTNGDDALGERIRSLREAVGLSQAEVAKRMGELGLGLHPSALTRIESGGRALKATEALVLAQVLGIRLDELVQLPPSEAHVDEAIQVVRIARLNASGGLWSLVHKVAVLEEIAARPGLSEAAKDRAADALHRARLSVLLKALEHRLMLERAGQAEMARYLNDVEASTTLSVPSRDGD